LVQSDVAIKTGAEVYKWSESNHGGMWNTR